MTMVLDRKVNKLLKGKDFISLTDSGVRLDTVETLSKYLTDNLFNIEDKPIIYVLDDNLLCDGANLDKLLKINIGTYILFKIDSSHNVKYLMGSIKSILSKIKNETLKPLETLLMFQMTSDGNNIDKLIDKLVLSNKSTNDNWLLSELELELDFLKRRFNIYNLN